MTIIKHSNGKYSIYSTVVDDFILINITKEEYIKIRQEELKKEIDNLFNKIDKEYPLSRPFNYSLIERLEIIEKLHGKERKEEVLKLLPKE